MKNEIEINNKYSKNKKYVFLNTFVLALVFVLIECLFMDIYIHYIDNSFFASVIKPWFIIILGVIIATLIDYIILKKLLGLSQKTIIIINKIIKACMFCVLFVYLITVVDGLINGVDFCIFTSCMHYKGVESLFIIWVELIILLVMCCIVFGILYFISNLLVKKRTNKNIAKND